MISFRNFRDSCVCLFLGASPSAAVSSISHFRVRRWVLMGTPEERPPKPHGTPRSGKMGECRIESGNLWIPGSSFCFPSSLPIYGGFVFLSSPRWVLGVNGRPRGTPPPGPHGTPRNGTIGKLRIASGILGVRGSAFCFLSPSPIYGGFVYLSFPRWAMGVNGNPNGTPTGTPRNATER